MKDLNSYIEDLLDENGEIPPFDPENVDIEKLQSDVATLFSDIFSGKAKGEEGEMVINMNGKPQIVKFKSYSL